MRILSVLAIGLVLGCGPATADSHAPPPTVYGQNFGLIVSDPAAVVAALTKYRNSETGKKMPTTVNLIQNVANGAYRSTHSVNVFYPSAEAMDVVMALQADSADSVEFRQAMRAAAEIEMENVYSILKTKVGEGKVTSANPVSMLFGMTVTDQTGFMEALNRIWNSAAADGFPGNMFFGQVIAMGSVPGTHWVSFQANDMQTLLSGVEAFMASADFAAYAKNADSFRRLEGRFVNRLLMSMPPVE